MDQRLSIITLPVADITASKAFYSGKLGWEPIKSPDENIVFYQLGGIQLALYPKGKFGEEIKGMKVSSDTTLALTLAHNTNSKDEVDKIFSNLKNKQVKILKEPEEVFWGGYSGYFADPDGNAWEVAYNPFTAVSPDGSFGK